MKVKVKILFFAQAKEIVGKKSDILEVPTPINCLELVNILGERYSLQELRNNFLVAVNEGLHQVQDNLSLKEGDEIAIIPPLSGG